MIATPAGKILLNYAKQILHLEREAKKALLQFRGQLINSGDSLLNSNNEHATVANSRYSKLN